MKIERKQYSLISGLLLVLLCAIKTANAQFITAINPSANTDKVLSIPGASGFNEVETLNSDMLDIGNTIGLDKLWAITYGQATSSTFPNSYGDSSGIAIGLEDHITGSYNILYIGLPDNSGTVKPIRVMHPDIVLGDYYDPNTTITHYYCSVVYEGYLGSTLGIYMEVYELTWSYPNITATALTGPVLLSTNTTQPAVFPHIDLSADGTNFSMPMPPNPPATYVPYMHKFAVVWSESVSSPPYVWEIQGVYGDLSTITSASTFTPTQIASSGYAADVACTYDPLSGADSAYVIYHDDPNATNMYMTPWDINGNMVGPARAAGTGFFFYPRIDAATIYNYMDPRAQTLWHAVSMDYVTGVNYNNVFYNYYRIFHTEEGHYGSLAGVNPHRFNYVDNWYPGTVIASTIPTSSSPSWYDQVNPSIAGTGDFLGGGISPSKDSFNVLFYSSLTAYNLTNNPMKSDGDFYAYGVDRHFLANGTITPVFPGWYYDEVDNSDLNFNPGNDATSAISTCTNSGFDVLTTWFDGDDFYSPTYTGQIKYKFGGSTGAYAFKTASVENISKQSVLGLYPVPTTSQLYLTNINTGTYHITDIVGREVQTGQVKEQRKPIDVSRILPGNYIISVTNETGTQKAKFTKQ